MDSAKINALLSSSYNLHMGPQVRGEPMTPAKAAELSPGDRALLAATLRDRGGSDLFTQEDAQAAYLQIIDDLSPTVSDDDTLSP